MPEPGRSYPIPIAQAVAHISWSPLKGSAVKMASQLVSEHLRVADLVHHHGLRILVGAHFRSMLWVSEMSAPAAVVGMNSAVPEYQLSLVSPFTSYAHANSRFYSAAIERAKASISARTGYAG